MIIFVKNNKILLDKNDYEQLKDISWHIGAKGYVMSNNNLYLNRVIMKTPKGMDTDHINGNKLDNRKQNLRIATRTQNNLNKGKQSTKASSKYKGVGWDKNRSLWMSFTTIKNKFKSFGRFKTEKEAAIKYNQEIIKYYGGFAKLNIIL
jgi:hypothetical protein